MATISLSHCRHWIFDMDGTLTLAVHDFEAIRKTLGIKAGKPILEAVDDMPEQQAQKIMQELFDIEMEIAAKSTEQPGARELLEQLSTLDCKLGILTRNDCEIAVETLKAAGLSDFFDRASIIGRESCAPKPDPAGIYHHLSAWQAAPDATVMVGDYKFDLESGFRAGVNTVHLDVDNGEQWPEMTTVRVSTLSELQQLTGAA